jgi:hypothetical protein
MALKAIGSLSSISASRAELASHIKLRFGQKVIVKPATGTLAMHALPYFSLMFSLIRL